MARVAFRMKDSYNDDPLRFGQEMDGGRKAPKDGTANLTTNFAEVFWIFSNSIQEFIDLLLELPTQTWTLVFIPSHGFIEFDPSDAAELNSAAHSLPRYL